MPKYTMKTQAECEAELKRVTEILENGKRKAQAVSLMLTERQTTLEWVLGHPERW